MAGRCRCVAIDRPIISIAHCTRTQLLQEAVQWLEKSFVEGKEASMTLLSVRVEHTRRFITAKEAVPQQAVVLLTALMHDMVR